MLSEEACPALQALRHAAVSGAVPARARNAQLAVRISLDSWLIDSASMQWPTGGAGLSDSCRQANGFASSSSKLAGAPACIQHTEMRRS